MSNEEEKANYDLSKKNLRKFFKLEHFRSSVQKDAVQTILMRKQDVAISMPPGYGKSLCFQLPGLMQENKLTMVFSPTSGWIKNQIYSLQKSKICAKAITTTTSENDREQVLSDLNSDDPKTRFLYVTPEQAFNETFSETFNNVLQRLHTNDKLAYFAVYDAHCACPGGEDFRNEYLKLGSLRSMYPSIPWIALTPKTSTEVQNEIVKNFQLRKPIKTFIKSSFRKHLFYDVVSKDTITDHFVHLHQYVTKSLGAADDNVKQNKKPCGIIYCRNRDSVDVVAKELTQQGVSTKAYHRGLKSRDRTNVLKDWIAGVFPVIIVTSSFSEVIDKSSVRFIVHWDVPQSVIGYYKESDRAGRDGRSSYCRIYYCEKTVNKIDSSLKTDVTKSKDKSKALRAHADFVKMRYYCESDAESAECRHKWFADYFDDSPPQCKDRCDVCKNHGTISAVHLENHPRETPLSKSNLDSHSIRIKEEPHSPDHASSNEINSGIVNGQSIKLERLEYTATTNEGQTLGNVSPARTIIKVEESAGIQDSQLNMGYANLSDFLFDMQTPAPGNVSPARTIIKEELNSTEVDRKDDLRNILPRPVSPAGTVIEEPISNELPIIKREVVSPRPTISPIDVRTPIINQNNIKSEPLSPGTSEQMVTVDPMIIEELSMPGIQPISCSNPNSEEFNNPGLSSFIPMSSTTFIDQNNVSDLTPANSTNGIHPANSSDPVSLVEPIISIESINLGLSSIPTSSNGLIVHQNVSNVAPPNSTSSIKKEQPTEWEQDYPPPPSSPTNTIIKDEQRSPEDFLENLSNHSQSSRPSSPEHPINLNENEPNSKHPSRKRSHSASSDGQKCKRESVDDRRHQSSLESPRNGTCTYTDTGIANSTPEYRNTTPLKKIEKSEETTEIVKASPGTERVSNHFNRNTRLSLSPTGTVIKEERRRPESTTSTKKYTKRQEDFEDNLSNRSYSPRTSSPQRYRENDTYSNERHSRYKQEHDDNRRHEHSKSSSRKRSHRRDSPKYSKSRKESRKRPRSPESDSSYESRKRRRSPESDSSYEDKYLHSRHRVEHSSGKRDRNGSRNEREVGARRTTSSDECRSPQPSTSAGARQHSAKNWAAGIRFSVSPTPFHESQRKEDSDSDYGWEYPAPPKPKPEVSSKSFLEDMDPEVQEKMKILNNDIKNEYDLDVIEAKKEELFRVIEQTIEHQAKKKLDHLTKEIQRRADDYTRNLFGTDNFDSWDDDPALSNVKMAKKLKPLKASVSDDVPLMEKMNMKHVIIQMHTLKITQSLNRNELVFLGQIKEIETKFQGQLPPILLESIKKEKSIIADVVKRYLMPYFIKKRIQPSDGRTQPKEFFAIVARKICHIFYDRFADENIIRDYIDDLFKKVGVVNSYTKIM